MTEPRALRRLDGTVGTLAARLRQRLAERRSGGTGPGGRFVLGIAGPPGVGKSTLAERMVGELGSHTAVVLPMDGFHLSSRELARLGMSARKGAPETFDVAGFAAALARIVAGDDDVVYVPHFDRDLEEPVAAGCPVPASVPLVITEGNYLLLDDPGWRRARAMMDEVWFVEEDPEVRLDRLRARHQRFGRSDAAARSWVQTVDEPNARIIEATASRADLVVRVRADGGGPW